jgi:hypothetical protein
VSQERFPTFSEKRIEVARYEYVKITIIIKVARLVRSEKKEEALLQKALPPLGNIGIQSGKKNKQNGKNG